MIIGGGAYPITQLATMAWANFSAGTSSNNLASVVFSDSNGVSFGLLGSTITASHNGLITAAQSNHSHGNPTLALTNLSGTTASASNGLTLSLSAGVGGGGSPFGVSAGSQSVSTGTLVFSNSNGITFGMSGSSRITVSHNGLTTAAQSGHSHGNPTLALTNLTGTTASASNGLTLSLSGAAPGLTTAALSNHSHGNPTLALTNLSGTTGSASDGLTLSLSAASIPPETPFGISAGTQSVSTGTLVFSNSNGITFGLGGSSRVTASHDGLTTAAASDHSHGNPTLALTNLSGTTGSASNGLTLSLSAASIPTAFGASQVSVSTLAGASYEDLQEIHDLTRAAGHLDGGEITDATAGNINVAAGQGFIRATADDTSRLFAFNWPAASGIVIPTNSIRYVRVDYSGGSPVVTVSATEDYDYRTGFPLGFVVNEGGTLYINQTPHSIGRGIGRLSRRNYEVDGRSRAEQLGGLILSESGTVRTLAITAGVTWLRGLREEFPSFDSNGPTDRFDRYYRDGAGGWTREAAQSQVPEAYWDDGTPPPVQITNKNYVNYWIYLGPSNGIVCVYGQQDNATLSAAVAEQPPGALPLRLQKGALLLGRIIGKWEAAVWTTIQVDSAFTSTFTPTPVSDHGALAGLADDDHPQYALTSAGVVRGIAGSNTTYTSGTALFSGVGGGITVGSNTGQRIDLSVAAPVAQVPFGLSAGSQSVSTGTLIFSNSNNLTFGMSGSSRITASYSQSNQQLSMFATGNTTQSSTGTSNASSLIFRGAGVASVGITDGSIVVSAPAAAPSPVNFSAGTTSSNLGSVVFSNSNGVSFGLNGSTITASAGGGVLPQRWTQAPAIRRDLTNLTNLTAIDRVPFFVPIWIPGALTFSRLNFEMSRAATGSNSFSVTGGFYTYSNDTRIALLTSFSGNFFNTLTASVSGIRRFGVAPSQTFSLAPGGYVFGLMFSQGASASMNYSLRGYSGSTQLGAIFEGSDTYVTATSVNIFPFYGRLSVSTAAFPGTVPDSDVRGQFSGASAPLNAWLGFNND